MVTELTPSQQILAGIVVDLITQASTLLGRIDEEIQSLGSTGENLINHTEYDLKCTAELVKFWIDNGVEI